MNDVTSAAETAPLDEIDAGRAQQYTLLSVLLLDAPDAVLLAQLSGLEGDETPLGAAYGALAAAARETTPDAVAREFSNLFIGLGRGELLPYGSYYQSGFLNDRPLARLRQDLEDLGIERTPGLGESEDHVAILCEVMAGLVSRTLPAPADADRAFFEAHLAPWAARFFNDLANAETAQFYRSVATLGRLFMEIESEAFALPPALTVPES